MRGYDYRYIQSRYPYSLTLLEKVCRMSDTLERITQIPFLRERLSMYGGTALNFIHLREIRRLSVDIDFNYRHRGEEADWGEIRAEIDENIKEVLGSLGYADQEIKIDASYPLSRFTVKYRNHLGAEDSFKIETGYMKRIPILASDEYMSFTHLGTGRSFNVKTPRREEIYANKLVTMLDRATPRDLYDVASISESSVSMDVLRKCTVVESLMSLKKAMTALDADQIVKAIPYNERIRSITSTSQKPSINEIRLKALRFARRITDNLTENEKLCINTFYGEKRFRPELLGLKEMHPDIRSHLGILWAMR